ncbi:MAG: hypothetical protein COS30_00115 [Candidatus Portnoybacteria bacterium CG02_land_8_20_14_3_00_45_8]|uniref:Type IV pilus modification protein PilV n=1 Tax=Candidatus Portnoybacteria bacterium CG02_land_8_20_14_3_00_45_8 TaxID=1974807 RepID=A0A2M7D722_9BACT|nr:MAG: hypothetical protein COS30_00115 [Candidatus Portnoybacteria bacterium CG02_land_8_20_14_3_00_45_8]
MIFSILKLKTGANSEQGFGLMEVIVSIFIISIGLMGVMALVNYFTIAGGTSASRLIAANLAQEGIEVVRNIRDLNFGTNGWSDWYAGIEGTTSYLVQYNDASWRAFSDMPLKYDSSAGLYGYDSGVDTSFVFKRKITLTKISDAEIKLVAEITWVEQNRSHILTVEDRLWNWR